MKKYTSLEHTIKKVVAEQNYKKPVVDEAISPVNYDKPKEVPQAFFKPVHIEPRKGEEQIDIGGPVRSRRNLEKEKSSETMHPGLKEQNKEEPSDEELQQQVKEKQKKLENYGTLKVGRRLGANNAPPLDPEKQKGLETTGQALSTITLPATALTIGTQLAKKDVAGAAETAGSYALGKVLAKPIDWVAGKALEGAKALSKRFDTKAVTSKPATPSSNPAPITTAPDATKDASRKTFRNFLKKSEPATTQKVELPGASIEMPKTPVATTGTSKPPANVNVKPPKATPEQDLTAAPKPPPFKKTAGGETVQAMPQAAARKKPELKVVPKEEPVAPPKVTPPSQTPRADTVKLPGVEITTPKPGIKTTETPGRPSREQNNVPGTTPGATPGQPANVPQKSSSTAAIPVVKPAAVPAAAPAPAKSTNPAAVPATRPTPNARLKRPAAKPKGTPKSRGRLRLPSFGAASGNDSSTPNSTGGFQIGGSPSRARSRITFNETARTEVEAVGRKTTKREDPIVGRPDSDRSKTMTRQAEIIRKIIEDKKIIIQKTKEENLGKNPLVDIEPKLKHQQLDQGSEK